MIEFINGDYVETNAPDTVDVKSTDIEASSNTFVLSADSGVRAELFKAMAFEADRALKAERERSKELMHLVHAADKDLARAMANGWAYEGTVLQRSIVRHIENARAALAKAKGGA